MALFLALATLPMLRGPAAAQISNPQLSTAPQLSTPPQPATPQSNFSAAQRAEIVALVRDALKTDPTILRDAVGALRADDGRMQEAAARAAINASGPHLTNESGDPIAGNPAGDVTVVEFYDVRCPYCRHMIPVIDQLLASDKGIRMVFKDLPILGPGSVLGSRALLAAQRQDGYMKLQSAIMRGPSDVTEETLKSQALAVGLDWPRLRRDMDDPAIQTRIDLNLALAKAISVEGTPAMIIGGKLLPGAMDLAGMQAAIQQARKEKG
jgi:protein-disulfide isomerase